MTSCVLPNENPQFELVRIAYKLLPQPTFHRYKSTQIIFPSGKTYCQAISVTSPTVTSFRYFINI